MANIFCGPFASLCSSKKVKPDVESLDGEEKDEDQEEKEEEKEKIAVERILKNTDTIVFIYDVLVTVGMGLYTLIEVQLNRIEFDGKFRGN